MPGHSLDPAFDASALVRAVQGGTTDDMLALLKHAELPKVTLLRSWRRWSPRC
ncbi:MAG: hypothetical protein ACLPUO_09005 [Streptosporangiaceae bacterium]|jgi:hypothetical protein